MLLLVLPGERVWVLGGERMILFFGFHLDDCVAGLAFTTCISRCMFTISNGETVSLYFARVLADAHQHPLSP